MKITKILYTATSQWGNYDRDRENITLEAELTEGDDINEAFNQLRELVHGQLITESKFIEIRNKYRDAERALNSITSKVEKAQSTWETVSEFLKAQGLNTDPAKFPQLPQLPQAEALEGELDF